jgi:hypothetical protein
VMGGCVRATWFALCPDQSFFAKRRRYVAAG